MPAITDRVIYLVVSSQPTGAYLREQNVPEMDRKTVVRDIAGGQYEDLQQVLELNPVEGICRDVSSDIIAEVMDLWADDGHSLDGWRRDFVEQTLGIEAANRFASAA